MSKELERIFNDLEYYTKKKDSNYFTKRDLMLLDKLHQLLKQAQTPPTEEEVCKALGKYYENNITYNKEEKAFYLYEYHNARDRILRLNQFGGIDITIGFIPTPHLLTMIGKFYKELSNNE